MIGINQPVYPSNSTLELRFNSMYLGGKLSKIYEGEQGKCWALGVNANLAYYFEDSFLFQDYISELYIGQVIFI